MQIVYLGTNNIPEGFQTLVENIRRDISCTHSSIQSDFKLHVTLGRITEPEADIDDVGFLIDEIDFKPFSLTLNEVEYMVFRGRSIYKTTLNQGLSFNSFSRGRIEFILVFDAPCDQF